MVINPRVGVYIPIVRIPIKGGMTIPNIATFDHGTFRFILNEETFGCLGFEISDKVRFSTCEKTTWLLVHYLCLTTRG